MASDRNVVAAGVTLAAASLMAFVANWEGDERTAYADKLAYGLPTVCNGHTGPDVKVGDVWTKEQCDEVLVRNLVSSLPKFWRYKLIINFFTKFENVFYFMATHKICCSFLVSLDYILLFNTCHTKAKICNYKSRNIGFSEEAPLVHAPTKKVES